MTAKLIKSILVMVMAVTLTAGLATAGEKMKVYEMGESDQTVAFKMTAEEIAAENAENARLAAINADNRQKSKAGLLVIEMGESGESISFPMSAEEIQRTALREAQEAAQRTAQQNMRANKPNVPVEECELCESGEIITFVKPGSAN
jgi:hypothetical protein